MRKRVVVAAASPVGMSAALGALKLGVMADLPWWLVIAPTLGAVMCVLAFGAWVWALLQIAARKMSL